MSQITTYKCDRCGKEDTKIFTSGVSIVINCSYRDKTMHSSDWCLPCLRELGIEPQPKPAKGDPAVPAPIVTIEDMIREIVRTEIQQ